jgi:hypothetical protein
MTSTEPADYLGKTWSVSFKGLAKTDFNKCLSMARKMNGRYDGSRWTFNGSYGINRDRLAEMADRGADIREA